jgi:hypothetical protein
MAPSYWRFSFLKSIFRLQFEVMKKTALILGIIFVVVTSVVYWQLRRSGPMTAAALVPSNTTILFEAPDLPSSIARWNASELCQLTVEPEIKNFLRRPLDRFYEKSGLLSNTMSPKIALDLLHKIRPGRLFAAVEPGEQDPSWIVGCQFFGDKDSLEEGIMRLLQRFNMPTSKVNEVVLKVEEHHGEIIKKRTISSLVFYTVLHDNWCFVSNDLKALQKTLDLCCGRTKSQESLQNAPLYQKNRHHLLLQGDLFCYVRESAVLEKIPYISMVSREEPLLSLAQATGASFCLTQEGMEENLFFSGDFNIEEHLSHQGLRITKPTTLGFIERLTNWKQIVENIKSNRALPLHFSDMLASRDLDLLLLATLLKPEMIMMLDWNSGSTFPTLLMTAPEADSEKVANWLDQAAPQLGGSLQASDQNDLLMISMPKVASTIEPCLASANGSFFISSDPVVTKETSNHNAASPTLESTPGFSKNKVLYDEANEAFFYFVSKEIVERAYTLARPSLLVGSAFFPQARALLDFSLLPSTGTLTKHLAPVVIAESHHEDGFLIQSRGPLSATPLFFLGRVCYQFLLSKKGSISPEAP